MEREMYGLHRIHGDILLALAGTLVLASILFSMAAYAPVPPVEAQAALDTTAGAVTVEILAADEPAYALAVADVERLLAGYGERVRVLRYDPRTPSGASFARRKGLSGDTRLVIFVNGTQTFNLNGQSVTFESRPAAGQAGSWSLAQLAAVLERLAR